MENNRLGLFGGTFDPPHMGHVAALRAAWATGRFDRLLVTVAGEPWHKVDRRAVAPASRRLAMARAAFNGLDGVEVSDREIRRPGPTYTIDTVEELMAEGWSVELLVGADAAGGLDTWHDADRLAAHVTVAIFPRDHESITLSPRWRCTTVDMEPVDLSSTWLRERVASGEDVARFLPPSVVDLFESRPG